MFEIKGATIINFNNTGSSIDIWYAEDDLVDEKTGIPYIICIPYYTYFGRKLDVGSRIMVLYGSDGSNYVLPINNVLWQYIGMNIPENVKNIDYEKAKRIHSTQILKMNEDDTYTTKEEFDISEQKYGHFTKIRTVIVSMGIIIALFGVILLIWAFTINEKMTVNQVLGLTGSANMVR